MNIAEFKVDVKKCIGCGKCVKVCPGGILYMNKNNRPEIESVAEFGWNGCWKCQHCLAVCPTAAISVFGLKPEESIMIPDITKAGQIMDSLVVNRHSCRRYKNCNVDKSIVNHMIDLLANIPNGGNKQQVEFILIDDKDKMEYFRRLAYREMEKLAADGIYPKGFDRQSYQQMKKWEKTVRPDMLFCGAPHLLIPHVHLGNGTPQQDAVIAGTYFELLCVSKGIGAVMMTFSLDYLELMPDIRDILQIPHDHYVPMIIGFGYPQITYKRGVQKKLEKKRIKRPFSEIFLK